MDGESACRLEDRAALLTWGNCCCSERIRAMPIWEIPAQRTSPRCFHLDQFRPALRFNFDGTKRKGIACNPFYGLLFLRWP